MKSIKNFDNFKINESSDKTFEASSLYYDPVKFDEEVVEDINDMVIDLVEDHNVVLACWLPELESNSRIESNWYWQKQKRLVSAPSLSISIYPRIKKRFLAKEEIEPMIDFIKRVNDYLLSRGDIFDMNIHYHTMYGYIRSDQKIIDVDNIDELIDKSWTPDITDYEIHIGKIHLISDMSVCIFID